MKKNVCAAFIAVLLIAVHAFAETGTKLNFVKMSGYFSVSESSTIYDPAYRTACLLIPKGYTRISFPVYFGDDACVIVTDENEAVIETILAGQYGKTMTYELPSNAKNVSIPVEKERIDEFVIYGYTDISKPVEQPESKEEENEPKAWTDLSEDERKKAIEHRKEEIKTEMLRQDDWPLETIIENGGMAKIFRVIGVVGDSLSSGAMTCKPSGEESKSKNVSMYEYSWIQYMARYCGSTAYNFSVSGMGTDTFFDSKYYDLMMDGEHLCQAYFIALGHNDYNRSVPVGTLEDVDLENWKNNAATFTGNYARIISEIKSIQPEAKIFPILMKNGEEFKDYNEAIRSVSALFDNIYLLEMDVYAVARQSWEVTNGHGNTLGYLNYSYQVSSYVDWYIRHYPDDFKYVQFIGTEYEFQREDEIKGSEK